MATEPKRNRRWFQFSLRMLLIVIAIMASSFIGVDRDARSRGSAMILPVAVRLR